MSIFKKIRIGMLIAILGAMFIPAMAAAASVNISVSGGTIEKGDTVTVTIGLSSSEIIGAYRFNINYDSSVVEYVPGAADGSFCNGGNGSLVIVDAPYQTSASYSITFKAKNAGQSSLAIAYDKGNILDANGSEFQDVAASNGTIKVNLPREASDDCTLSSLIVGEGSLTPGFSAGVTEYKLSGILSADVSSLSISATANSPYASVSVKNNSLSEGSTVVSVVVTAETGVQKTYSITVERAAATPTPTPTNGAELKAGAFTIGESGELVVTDTMLTISDTITAGIPAGYEQTVMNILGIDVPVLKAADSDKVLIQLSDGELYIFTGENAVLMPYRSMETLSRKYNIAEAEESDIPAGYELVGIEIDGKVYPAYKAANDETFCLFYTDEGVWYKYDIVESTMQRYMTSEDKVVYVTSAPVTVIPAAGTATDATAEPGKSVSSTEILKICLFAVSCLLAVVFMVLFIREKNRNEKGDADGSISPDGEKKESGEEAETAEGTEAEPEETETAEGAEAEPEETETAEGTEAEPEETEAVEGTEAEPEETETAEGTETEPEETETVEEMAGVSGFEEESDTEEREETEEELEWLAEEAEKNIGKEIEAETEEAYSYKGVKISEGDNLEDIVSKLTEALGDVELDEDDNTNL